MAGHGTAPAAPPVAAVAGAPDTVASRRSASTPVLQETLGACARGPPLRVPSSSAVAALTAQLSGRMWRYLTPPPGVPRRCRVIHSSSLPVHTGSGTSMRFLWISAVPCLPHRATTILCCAPAAGPCGGCCPPRAGALPRAPVFAGTDVFILLAIQAVQICDAPVLGLLQRRLHRLCLRPAAASILVSVDSVLGLRTCQCCEVTLYTALQIVTRSNGI